MRVKRTLQLWMAIAVLAVSLLPAGNVFAGGVCAGYVTVQWGDTVNSIAAACGITVEDLQAANPGLGWWLYTGQVLYIPTMAAPMPVVPVSNKTYTVQWGDTLGSIAAAHSVSLNDLLACNPKIWNVNLIFPGQILNLPGTVASIPAPAYVPPPPVTTCTANCAPAVPPPTTAYGKLSVSYNHGLSVRTGPGRRYDLIVSPYVSAVKDSVWEYRKDSISLDENGYVWVEVKLNPLAPYSTGWILVRDTLGKYYTEPKIDP